jgi:copper chaperone NosL
MRTPLTLLLVATLFSCGGLQPETLVKGQDICALCRMPVSDVHFAGQVVIEGELPFFFDDPGCLGEFVRSGQIKGRTAVAWVADHRTGDWVRADRAIYTRAPNLTTPMNHKLIAHEDAASRDADPDARGGTPVGRDEIFGPEGPPAGEPS